MKRFTARLEATDGSGNFRLTRVYSESIEEAEAALLRTEAKYTAAELGEEDAALIDAQFGVGTAEALLRAADPRDLPVWGQLSGDQRSKVALHRQKEQYVIAWIAEGAVGPGGPRPTEGEGA